VSRKRAAKCGVEERYGRRVVGPTRLVSEEIEEIEELGRYILDERASRFVCKRLSCHGAWN
jgi:hypothetical protein